MLSPAMERGWVDLGVRVTENRAFVGGYLARADGDQLLFIDSIRVDTGFNGFLLAPLGHRMVEKAWVSAEIGGESLAAVSGRRPMWTGAVPGLAIAGVLTSPTPLTVTSETTGWASQNVPLLGQLWFDIAEATWIDLGADTIAVSFQPHAVDEVVRSDPTLWVKLPWRKNASDGHRTVPISVGEQDYNAIIDTGSVVELFIETNHPPQNIQRPWQRGRLAGATTGSIFRARSTVPLVFGEYTVHEIDVSWSSRRSEFFADLRTNRPTAILGVPFLRKYPVLLDHRNDHAYIFIGERGAVPDIFVP